MGRKKKTEKDDPDKEPWWLEDPYDNTLPWGAPIVTAKEIAEEIDKAPPFSYFKAKNIKELIPKKKRTRRRKHELDELMKDPLTELREGLEFIKQKHQRKQQESNEKTQDIKDKKHVDAKYPGLVKNFSDVKVNSNSEAVKDTGAIKDNSSSDAVKDTGAIKEDLKENFVMENITSDQKDCSVAKTNDQKEDQKPPNEAESSASTFAKREIKNKRKSKKKEEYKHHITELSKELEGLKSQIALLTKVLTSSTNLNTMERKPVDISSNNDAPNDLKEKENERLQVAEKSATFVSTNGSKTEGKKDGKALGGIKEEDKGNYNPNPSSEYDSQIKPSIHVSNSDLTIDESRKTRVGFVEKESAKPDTLETGSKSADHKPSASKSESNKKRKIRPRKKEARKDRKMVKKFFKDLKNKGYPKETLSGPYEHNFIRPNISPTFSEENGGNTFPQMGSGSHVVGDPNNMYGTSIPLDDEFIGNSDHTKAKLRELNISKFLNSTLQPGDGFVLGFDNKDKIN